MWGHGLGLDGLVEFVDPDVELMLQDGLSIPEALLRTPKPATP